MQRLLLLLLALALMGGSFNSGSQTCPASGNKKVAATNTPAGTFTIQAPTANTGTVYIGGSSVSSASGVYLNAGDSYTGPSTGASSYDLSNVYMACSVSGDTITYVYLQ